MEEKDEIRIIHVKETDSTNEEVFRLKDKVKIPFFVRADVQVKGRGRYGRVWVSQEGGLWMTGLFEKKGEYDGIKFMFGSALVVYKILLHMGINARIKFPNDVYYKDKKLCGILAEERENLIAVGIGLNVNQKEPPIPSSTTLHLITGKTYDLEFLAYNIGKGLMEIERKSIGEVVREYRENLSTIGKTVKIFTPSGALEGTFEDLDMDLNVILRGDVIYVIPAFEVLHLEEYER